MRSFRRAANTTFAPAAYATRAKCNPKPPEAPVTSTRRFARENSRSRKLAVLWLWAIIVIGCAFGCSAMGLSNPAFRRKLVQYRQQLRQIALCMTYQILI